MIQDVELSVIVPVCDLYDKSGVLARDYLEELAQIGKQFELLYVLDGEHKDLIEALNELASADSRLRIVQLAKNFGEATALTAGFAYTTGSSILTLPAYIQIKKGEIRKVLDELQNCDVAVATRVTRAASTSRFKSTRRKLFHWLVSATTGQSFSPSPRRSPAAAPAGAPPQHPCAPSPSRCREEAQPPARPARASASHRNGLCGRA